MNFDLLGFVRTNKRVFIWTAFFGLLYLVRGFFGLVFLTFILCFVFNNLIEWLERKSRLPRRLWTVLIYIVFLALVVTAVSYIFPRLIEESRVFINQIPETQEKVHDFMDRLAEQQPNLAPLTERAKEGLSIKTLAGTDKKTLVALALASFSGITHYFSFILLGTLFSFLILFDYPNLRARTTALSQTRLREVYDETADSVVQFARVVGASFQAQMLIACINTMLTSLGLWGLGIHPIALLSAIVLMSGLIPVLGVFISSVPIILVTFNTGGFRLAAAGLVMIIIVHIIEAYILNPNIISAVMKINPVLILIILYIGYSLFGLWGVLLGVPVAVYIYRRAILERPARG
ncbi:MAG: AI-2E family transporter [Proteobacteria bacterium]|nr:AI-2E family transporter [Pseudomonadota bacterium]